MTATQERSSPPSIPWFFIQRSEMGIRAAGFRPTPPAKVGGSEHVRLSVRAYEHQQAGLYPNTEIGCPTNQGENLRAGILRCSGGSAKDVIVTEMTCSLLASLQPQFIVLDAHTRAKKISPSIFVCPRECLRENDLAYLHYREAFGRSRRRSQMLSQHHG